MGQLELSFLTPAIAAALVGTGLCGLLAVVSPTTFAAISVSARRQIDSNRWLAWLDKEVHVDDFFLRHARVFGLIALAATLTVTWVLI